MVSVRGATCADTDSAGMKREEGVVSSNEVVVEIEVLSWSVVSAQKTRTEELVLSQHESSSVVS